MHKHIDANSKQDYREFLLSQKRDSFNIRDILCAKEILQIIQTYKIPKTYKIYKNNNIRYIANQTAYNNILIYMPMLSEVRINSIIKKLCASRKHVLFIPKVDKVDFKLVKYTRPLLEGRFGIRESSGRIYQDVLIHVAVIPVLGVDKNFARIGFGKGMYDRFFHKLKNDPYKIFVSRKHFISREKLGCAHDITANIYVSCYK